MIQHPVSCLFTRSGSIISCDGIQRNTEESPPSEFPLKISGSQTSSSMRSKTALSSISNVLNVNEQHLLSGEVLIILTEGKIHCLYVDF